MIDLSKIVSSIYGKLNEYLPGIKSWDELSASEQIEFAHFCCNKFLPLFQDILNEK